MWLFDALFGPKVEYSVLNFKDIFAVGKCSVEIKNFWDEPTHRFSDKFKVKSQQDAYIGLRKLDRDFGAHYMFGLETRFISDEWSSCINWWKPVRLLVLDKEYEYVARTFANIGIWAHNIQ